MYVIFMDMLQFCFETFLLHVFYFLLFILVCIFFLFFPHPLHFSNGPSLSGARRDGVFIYMNNRFHSRFYTS